MPNDNIDRAVRRGSGQEAGGAQYETITYEGYGPGGVAVLVQCLTDNRNRAASDVRVAFTRNGGSMADPGSVSYLFSRKGVVIVNKTRDLAEDDVLTAVLDAGAEEVNDLGDSFEIISEPTDMVAVRTALQDAGIDYESADAAFLPGVEIDLDEDQAAALRDAAHRVSASYEFPFLAHAPMEPLDAVVKLTANSCEIWAGDQFQTVDQANAAKIAGLDPQQVSIHTLYAGGSFGRRANAYSDYIVEAVSIAKAYGADGTPIKLQWTREDDIHGGLYRPMYYHKLEAGLSDKKELTGWRQVIVGQSIMSGTLLESLVKDGIDPTSVEGAANLAYAIPNISVDLATTKTGVPVLWWRVVGSSHTTFAVEAFIDEVAHAAGEDGFTFRRRLLEHHPRMKGVLELAAEKAGWSSTRMPKGKGRGIAVAEAFKTFVAQVAEVSVDDKGYVTVDRVVCAVDCGTPINPDVIAAQMEGGIGFGLGAILYGAITLKDGRVEQDNFNSYRVLRMNEMPKVEVHIVPSTEAPTGVGEPGVAPVGPAVANAVFAATGKRVYVLPFPKPIPHTT